MATFGPDDQPALHHRDRALPDPLGRVRVRARPPHLGQLRRLPPRTLPGAQGDARWRLSTLIALPWLLRMDSSPNMAIFT